jgi:hypothetical protein
VKVIWWFLLATIVFSGSCHREYNVSVPDTFKSLLFRKEYFRMRDQLEKDSSRMDDFHRMFYRAFVENAFGQYAVSIQDVKQLQRSYRTELSDSDQINLLGIQEGNYYNTCQYSLAAAADDALLKGFSTTMNPQEIRITRNSFKVWKALSNEEPQTVSMNGTDSVTWKRDAIGLMEIPVSCSDSTFQMVFDTRAGISTVTATTARQMNLRKLKVNFDLGSGVTGILFNSGLAVADSLKIGNIIMKQVVFQVVSDSMLYFAPIHFSIHGIFGFAAMRALGQVEILKSGFMRIPGDSTSHNAQNLALDGYDPVISLIAFGDTLPFYFDSGASSSDLYSLFFKKYKSKVSKEGKVHNIQLGGAGGVIRTNVWELPRLEIKSGSAKAVLNNAVIHTKPLTEEADKFYGNIGQDFISQFKEVTINFCKMYVILK